MRTNSLAFIAIRVNTRNKYKVFADASILSMYVLEAHRSRRTISKFPGIRRLSSRCCHMIHTYILCYTRISRFLLTHARICYLADLSIGNSCVKGGIARPRRLRLEIQFWTLGRGLSSIFIRDELSFWQILWLTVARKEHVSRKSHGLSMSAHVSSIHDKSVFFFFLILSVVEKVYVTGCRNFQRCISIAAHEAIRSSSTL